MEMQQEGVLFASPSDADNWFRPRKCPSFSRTSSQQHREELGKVVRSPGFPLTPHTPGKNWKTVFGERPEMQ